MERGILPEGINYTDVVLIPKKDHPSTMKELRPIALCKVVYKVVANVLANQLKCILPNIISELQSAFVPNRLITNNIIMANEIMHFMKGRGRGQEGHAALKIYIAKAYDKLEWDYMANMMRALGFCERLIELVMMCVMTISFTILLGDHCIGPVIPERPHLSLFIHHRS